MTFPHRMLLEKTGLRSQYIFRRTSGLCPEGLVQELTQQSSTEMLLFIGIVSSKEAFRMASLAVPNQRLRNRQVNRRWTIHPSEIDDSYVLELLICIWVPCPRCC